MAVINVIAKFIGTDVQTGLERLDAQAQKFSANLGKTLTGGSLSSLLVNLAAGFGALQLKDGLVNAFRTVADEATRAADASERMKDAVNSSIKANTNAEGALINSKTDVRGDQLQLAAANARIETFKDGFGIDYRTANPVIGALHSFLHPGARDYFNSLIAEQQKYAENVQRGSGEITAQERNIRRANRLAGYETDRSTDEGEVMRGSISRVEALKREADRASNEYNQAMLDPTKSFAEREAARAAANRADNALIPAQVQLAQFQQQGITPQVSASSLARIGGGGNVNVFGGREGALELEAKTHTALLQTIAINTGKAAGLTDVQ